MTDQTASQDGGEAKPRRRYILKIEIAADSEADAIDEVKEMAVDFARNGIPPWSMTGGFRSSRHHELDVDETWDGERYRKALTQKKPQ